MGFPKIGQPQIINFNRISRKQSIWGVEPHETPLCFTSQELLKAVEDAKEAASVAATAAAEAKKEMEIKSHPTVHSTSIPRLAPNVAYATLG